MKSGTICEVCGKPLPAFSKSFVCGDACRKRKSRLRLDAGKNMIAARNAVRDVIKGLDLDIISSRDSYDEYTALVDLLDKLREAHNARYGREMDEDRRAREKEEKKR